MISGQWEPDVQRYTETDLDSSHVQTRLVMEKGAKRTEK